MKKILSTLVVFFAAGMFAQKSSTVPSALYRCWAASYEENKEDSKEKVYRPCENQFPPSRFRQTIHFDKNGTCKVLMVGETDIHYEADCKWSYDKKKRIVFISDDKSKVKMKFKLVKVEKDILKIVFIE
jgi:hypothetical protein